jgi:phytoene/squalene synthetase
MSRSLIERRLTEVSQRLRRVREELSLLDEQREVFNDAAEDARVRSLVSETPIAHREYEEAQRHADAMDRSRRLLVSQIAQLSASQDELLDRRVVSSD